MEAAEWRVLNYLTYAERESAAIDLYAVTQTQTVTGEHLARLQLMRAIDVHDGHTRVDLPTFRYPPRTKGLLFAELTEIGRRMVQNTSNQILRAVADRRGIRVKQIRNRPELIGRSDLDETIKRLAYGRLLDTRTLESGWNRGQRIDGEIETLRADQSVPDTWTLHLMRNGRDRMARGL